MMITLRYFRSQLWVVDSFIRLIPPDVIIFCFSTRKKLCICSHHLRLITIKLISSKLLFQHVRLGR